MSAEALAIANGHCISSMSTSSIEAGTPVDVEIGLSSTNRDLLRNLELEGVGKGDEIYGLNLVSLFQGQMLRFLTTS